MPDTADTDAPGTASLETPLEAAARREAEEGGAAGQARREEHEADVVIGDVDEYVARTDPASLPEAEHALDDWQIPTDPLAGVPGDVALAPGEEVAPLVSIFEAGSETEANIVRGLLEAGGIPVTFDGVPAPALGDIFESGSARWGALLVPAAQADAARAALADAQEAGRAFPSDDSASDTETDTND